jgi:outer membrane protein OmpA-like peptidoglycan-associated protein
MRSRLSLSAAVPLVALLAVVSIAAMPGPPAHRVALPATTTTTTTEPPTSTTTTTAPLLGAAGNGSESVVRKGDQLEVTLATDVLFEFNSATLAPSATASLAALAPRIPNSAAHGVVSIVGYTDSIGTDAFNQSLSEARAQAVQAVLATARPDLQFQVSGRGANDPVAPNQIAGHDNPDGRARNRRVTITFTAPP